MLNEKNDPVKLIRELLKVKGAVDYSGECSLQVLLPTAEGKLLRVGITDEDVGTGKLWFDYYSGLNNELSNYNPPKINK